MSPIKEVLDILRFELKFVEDGGYGRSPKLPWRAPLIFEDSPTCLNFLDATRPLPCSECALNQFVPPEHRAESVPCRFIRLTEHHETIDHLYSTGTQAELEEALKNWLRKEIRRLEAQDMPALHPVAAR
jgi:hypothetical protein